MSTIDNPAHKELIQGFNDILGMIGAPPLEETAKTPGSSDSQLLPLEVSAEKTADAFDQMFTQFQQQKKAFEEMQQVSPPFAPVLSPKKVEVAQPSPTELQYTAEQRAQAIKVLEDQLEQQALSPASPKAEAQAQDEWKAPEEDAHSSVASEKRHVDSDASSSVADSTESYRFLPQNSQTPPKSPGKPHQLYVQPNRPTVALPLPMQSQPTNIEELKKRQAAGKLIQWGQRGYPKKDQFELATRAYDEIDVIRGVDSSNTASSLELTRTIQSLKRSWNRYHDHIIAVARPLSREVEGIENERLLSVLDSGIQEVSTVFSGTDGKRIQVVLDLRRALLVELIAKGSIETSSLLRLAQTGISHQPYVLPIFEMKQPQIVQGESHTTIHRPKGISERVAREAIILKTRELQQLLNRAPKTSNDCE